MVKRPTDLTCDDVRIPEYESMDRIELTDTRVRTMAYCSVKYDGYWLGVYVDHFGVVSAWTRRNKNFTEAVQKNRWFFNIQKYVTGPTWFLGELWQQNCPCSSISTFVAQRKPLQFKIFSCTVCKTLEDLSDYCTSFDLDSIPYIKNASDFNSLSLQKYYDSMKRTCNPADGLVLTSIGGRSYKWKPFKTIDLIYRGFSAGKGRNRSSIGAVLLETTEGCFVAKASGMSDTERRFIKKHSEELKGSVIEVKYMGVGSKGKLRHPTFVRFREDKKEQECVLEQDYDLLRYWRNLDA